MKKRTLCLAAIIAAAGTTGAAHAQLTVQLHEVTEKGIERGIGSVKISESEYGLVFTPDLKGLAPGIHGFHIHENPSCDASQKDGKMTPALAAGGHLDPDGADAHGVPWGDGHLGDLPALYVQNDGTAITPVLAPRLTSLSDVRNRSLMIHEGGDNYSDDPHPLGGGGGRVACGVIEK